MFHCIRTHGGEASGLNRFSATPIILQTGAFLVFSKPAGLETISGDGGPDLAQAVRMELDEPGLVPAHRLDRDTSGAQLFARTEAAEKKLIAMFRRREIAKTYLALCLGAPRNRTGVVNRSLSGWGGGRRPVRVLKKGGLEASTGYEALSVGESGGLRIGLLAFHPRQGRTHQIRVHAAALGCPVLGDDQYGDRPANLLAKRLFGLRRQALHSWRLEFEWEGRRVCAEAPLPPDMAGVIEALSCIP